MASDQQVCIDVLRRLLDGRRGRLSPGTPDGRVRPHIRVSTDLFLTHAEHAAVSRATTVKQQ